MSVEEKFYLLVMDEVRAQPGLAEGLPFDLETHAQQFAGCSLNDALKYLSHRKPCDGGLGFDVTATLGSPPQELSDGLSAIQGRLTMDLEQDYRLLCRQGLLNLIWRRRQGAEERINLAKYLKDEWAFAHFIYGLLRGLSGDLGRAHFELYLAINRETLVCARSRVERALELVR